MRMRRAGLVVSFVLLGFLAAAQAFAEAPPKQVEKLSADKATSLRKELLPLVRAGQYESAAKLATATLGDEWCGVTIEGFREAYDTGPSEVHPPITGRWDRAFLQTHFRLFGALTVLARQQGKLEQAARCALASSEYAIDSISTGMVAFEMFLIGEKMSLREFSAFSDFPSVRLWRHEPSCELPHHRGLIYPLVTWFDIEQKIKSGRGEIADAQRLRAKEEAVERWLRYAFEMNPTPAAARRLLGRKVMSRGDLVARLMARLPVRVTPRRFDAQSEAMAWLRDDAPRETGLEEEYKVGEPVWDQTADAPYRVAGIAAVVGFDSSTSHYALVASDSTFLLIPVMVKVAGGSWGGSRTSASRTTGIRWLPDEQGKPKLLELTAERTSWMNNGCEVTSWEDSAEIVCAGSEASSHCVNFGEGPQSFFGSRLQFGGHYDVTVKSDGTLRLRAGAGDPSPLAMRTIYEEMEGKSVEEIYQSIPEWRMRIIEQFLGK